MNHGVFGYIFVMALVTYLIRSLPLTLIRQEIKSPFIKSFLMYVPYATLAAMTFPAILTATNSVWSALAGFAAALVLAFMKKSLIMVAAGASAAVFVLELILLG
ncbi:MAG: AzlD domain-containing protein [Lachnospiraceae bacterium]|jgi:branched-subunit amino acid transport protein|nr:AzlD domain-containing protein [Lachnospiraceae bacterium]MBR6397619.1 AzlD domain-containing protein [Lachnospiraceae bacterium]MBR7016897.1 AzlD domain-containing protein [Lachnospiraceae bacterium]MEE3377573.1 AzlD domain-containing protein [Lachnospiraceae bacterium]MEE3457592.1 AzlD domain-containing protein [Lachnospiraceae bacterium]